MPAEIPAIHFADALALIGRHGADLGRARPRAGRTSGALGEWARREHGSDFLFVTGYPMVEAAVLHPSGPGPAGVLATGSTCCSAGIELVTGGQRLHRYDDYVAALAARGEPTEPYESYLDAFRHGMPPHGGFAIGLERFMMRLLEVGQRPGGHALPARPAPPRRP